MFTFNHSRDQSLHYNYNYNTIKFLLLIQMHTSQHTWQQNRTTQLDACWFRIQQSTLQGVNEKDNNIIKFWEQIIIN